MAALMLYDADDLFQAIAHVLDLALQQNNVYNKQLKFGRRNGDFSKGDMFLSRGCIDISKEVYATVQDNLKKADRCFIKAVTQDKLNSIVIYLNREKYFKDTVSCALDKGRRYGYDAIRKAGLTVINSNFIRKDGHLVVTQIRENVPDNKEIKEVASLDSVRSFLIQEHLSLLFEANGLVNVLTFVFNTLPHNPNVDEPEEEFVCKKCRKRRKCRYEIKNLMPSDTCSTVTDVCTSLDVDVQKFTKLDVSTDNIDFLLKSLEGNPCIYKSADKVYEFNLKQYMEEKNIQVGRNWFDKNLNTCHVYESGSPTDVFRQAVMLSNSRKSVTSQRLLHISGQSLSFTSQKVDLLLKVFTESEALDQVHFLHSGVCKAKGCEEEGELTFDTYFELRYSQMKEAAVVKYGDAVQGKGWEDTLRLLTLACVKFELLANTPRNTIKLKLDSKEERSGERSLQGSFVMYNCARLATLLSNFEENVKNGTYPPLPPIESVDFSTLREEEEWGLLFNYVYPYPDIVRETVKEIDTKRSLFVPLHTHKIPQMLIGVSRCVSSYYSRYHVLGEARPHLLPTMYARLYLLMAVHQVMCNGLRLMSITPLSQL